MEDFDKKNECKYYVKYITLLLKYHDLENKYYDLLSQFDEDFKDIIE